MILPKLIYYDGFEEDCMNMQSSFFRLFTWLDINDIVFIIKYLKVIIF